MCPQLNLVEPPIKTDPLEAATTLGTLLTHTPEYKAFITALKAVNSDPTIQNLSTEMRAHQTALQWGGDADRQHAVELTRLELEIEDLPAMKEYREREKEVSALFQAVDRVISQEAGLDFAVNAERTGCSCSG